MAYQIVTNAPGTGGLFNHRLAEYEPGMGGFSLEFLNSDHHVGSLRVGGVPHDGMGRVSSWRDYLLGFNDHDAGISGRETDPVRMTAKYRQLAALPTFTTSGTGHLHRMWLGCWAGSDPATGSRLRNQPGDDSIR